MDTNTTKPTPEEEPLTPEEIKAIGEIQIGPAKHEVFLNKHYKKLIAVGAVVAVAATTAIGLYAHGEQKEKNAAALMVQAGAPTPAAYDDAALKRIQSDYPETNSAETAKMYAALRAMTDASDTAAVDTMKQLADSAKSAIHRQRACAALAYYYMDQGDSDQAIVYWTKIIQMPAGPYSARAFVYLCDIAWGKGKTDEAYQYLMQLQELYPNSAVLMDSIQFVGIRKILLENKAEMPIVEKPENAIFNQSFGEPQQPAQPGVTVPEFRGTIPDAAPVSAPQPTAPTTDFPSV